MKRHELIGHLQRHGCQPEREGARHSIYTNRVTGAKVPVPRHSITPAEMAACLKRIRKSVDRWNKESGPRGYLNFVRQYIV